MKSFCEILRELREDRDMTQADVANLLGTSQQYYSKYETGKYEMPIHYVVPLADFYGYLWTISWGARPAGYAWRNIKSQSSPGTRQTSCWRMY